MSESIRECDLKEGFAFGKNGIPIVKKIVEMVTVLLIKSKDVQKAELNMVMTKLLVFRSGEVT